MINPTGTSSVIVTLFEKCKNTINPYFTWEIIRKGSFDTIVFYQNDISTSPYYYNQFELIVGTNSLGLTAGIIPITSGEWNYTIYEMANPYNLATASAVGIVETGLLINGATFSNLPIYTGESNNVIPVYKMN